MVQPEPRLVFPAEQHIPDLLSDFLIKLEKTRSTEDVWTLCVRLGQSLGLPKIDYVVHTSKPGAKLPLFARTSYDARWMQDLYVSESDWKWSYLQSHAIDKLTPIAVGLEFIDDFQKLPAQRKSILQAAARHGMRSGFAIPARYGAPVLAALFTFSGDHSRREMQAIIAAHGWTLNVAALSANQRYLFHYHQELADRYQITDKQQELLTLVGKGLQDKQIAEKLGISISAVRQRMNQLLLRTGLANRADLVSLAMSADLIPHPLHRPDAMEGVTRIIMDGVGDWLLPEP